MSIKHKDFNNEILDDSFILLSVLKDEYILLEYFINYYEKLGVTHFIFIDNNSSDGSFEYLLDKKDTNMMLFKNTGSYKSSNLGILKILSSKNLLIIKFLIIKFTSLEYASLVFQPINSNEFLSNSITNLFPFFVMLSKLTKLEFNKIGLFCFTNFNIFFLSRIIKRGVIFIG